MLDLGERLCLDPIEGEQVRRLGIGDALLSKRALNRGAILMADGPKSRKVTTNDLISNAYNSYGYKLDSWVARKSR